MLVLHSGATKLMIVAKEILAYVNSGATPYVDQATLPDGQRHGTR